MASDGFAVLLSLIFSTSLLLSSLLLSAATQRGVSVVVALSSTASIERRGEFGLYVKSDDDCNYCSSYIVGCYVIDFFLINGLC